MTTLRHAHLMTLSLNVDYAGMITIGQTPAGLRRIAPVTSGTFSGSRLAGTVLPGADWVINRADAVMVLDVRLTLLTDDSVHLYLSYQGRFRALPDVMARLARGEPLDPDDYSIAVSGTLECGDDRYRWVNDAIIVGTGTRHPHGPVYEFFEID